MTPAALAPAALPPSLDAPGGRFLPDWLSDADYARARRRWLRAWSFGVQRAWPEPWQRRLAVLPGALLLACVEILNAPLLSVDRRLLHFRLLGHLEAPSAPFPHPFERSDLRALVRSDHVELSLELESALSLVGPGAAE